MSKNLEGAKKGKWTFTKESWDGRVKLGFNEKSGFFRVYLYKSGKSEQWLMYAMRKKKDEAKTIFYTVKNMLK